MALQKTNESMNLDNQKQATEQKQINDIIIPNSETLKKYEQYDLFVKTVKLDLDEETRKKMLAILSAIPTDELDMYMMMDAQNTNLIDKQAIDTFIIEKWKIYLVKETKTETQKNHEKKFDSDYTSDSSLTDKWQKEGTKVEAEKAEIEAEKAEIETEKAEIETEEKEKSLKILDDNKKRFKEIFWENSEFFQLFEKFKDKELVSELEKFLSKPENRKAVFEKLAQSWDDKLYNSTKQALESLSPNIKNLLSDISDYPLPLATPPEYFPTAKEWEVTKRWDVVSYGDASVDLKTGKAYITSENWYKLEAHVDKLDAMPTRIKFQKERLDILEKLETEKTFQKNAETTLKYIKEEKVFDKKKDLEKELENKKSEKKSPKKSANELQIDLEITQIERELELVNKKIDEIKKAFPKDPNQKEEDYIENLGNFLETKLSSSKQEIEKLGKQLEENKENYEKEISDLLEKNWKEVNNSLETTRRTTLLLDSIGFTLIPQHITDDIIATINKNPEHYWFESRIDLKNGNFGWINNTLTKERFIKKFNKMISWKEWEPITSEDINNILVKKLEKDKDSQGERNKELLAKFSTYNIMSDLWTWDREKLESNLTLKEKETTNKETK